jgi:hypothetical protein
MPVQTIEDYHAAQTPADQAICAVLRQRIDHALPDAASKIWHAHPVWFLRDKPIVGYSRLKSGLQLLFWSGQSFANPGLQPERKFKAAAVRYDRLAEVDCPALDLWLAEARVAQWDFANIVRRKGRLERIT